MNTIEESYKIYLAGCTNRKRWLKKCKSTWYRRLFYYVSNQVIYDKDWAAYLTVVEKVLGLAEEEKKIFND